MMHPIALYKNAKNQELLMTSFRENAPKTKVLKLNFTLLTSNFMQIFRKNNEQSQRYSKMDGRTNGQTNSLTDKGNYY